MASIFSFCLFIELAPALQSDYPLISWGILRGYIGGNKRKLRQAILLQIKGGQHRALRCRLFDFALDPDLQFRFGDFQIVVQLQVQPGLCICAKVPSQPQCKPFGRLVKLLTTFLRLLFAAYKPDRPFLLRRRRCHQFPDGIEHLLELGAQINGDRPRLHKHFKPVLFDHTQ